ncbi:MAG TPA: ABC transporter ATP-binding protein [Clostridiales bacterium]|nr:ABC transporter ATP-binding protein [Clostridiales bacterium]
MEIFKKVYSFAEQRGKYMGRAILLLSLGAVFGVVPYYEVYRIILQLISHSTEPGPYIGGAAIILVSLLLKNLATEYGLKASHHLAYNTLAGMRKHAADKLLKMPMGNIQQYGSGELKKIFVENIEAMELVLAHGIPEGIGNILGIIVTLLAMFFVDWRLALLSLAVLPIGMLVIGIMGRNSSKKLAHYYQSSQNMNNSIVEYIRGMKVIKVFVRGDTSFAQYRKAIREYKEFSLDWYKSCWKYMAVYGVILPATWLFVLPFGMLFYLEGSLGFAALVLSLLFALAVGPMFMKLVVFIPILPTLTEKYKRIEVLYDQPDMKSGHIDEKLEYCTVAFENVTFAYQEKEVLRNINFVAREGQVTALVGESGAGKSTVGRLLARFWDVKSGSIKLNGIDIREYSFDALMDSVSYVTQDSFLFDTTIMENLRHGNPKATEEEVIAIAKKARCHDFIAGLPSGYQTKVGEAGDRLSGGQRQRITIARAMLKNSPIVILDEATSSTDTENEDLIQEALNELLLGKTVLVIAHRLSTIAHADSILVLKHGEIAAMGTHAELLAASKDYQHMWKRYEATADWKYQTQEIGG